MSLLDAVAKSLLKAFGGKPSPRALEVQAFWKSSGPKVVVDDPCVTCNESGLIPTLSGEDKCCHWCGGTGREIRIGFDLSNVRREQPKPPLTD